MVKRWPFQRHLILFLALSLIGFAQLGWWIIFQVREGVRISRQQHFLWEQQQAIAEQWVLAHGTEDGKVWIPQTFPDLQIDRSGNISISTTALTRLDRTAARRVRMFAWEGGFFTLLMISGMAFVYWTLRKEVEFERRQSTFLAATSHELKTPIASLRLFLDTLQERQLTPEQRTDTFCVMHSDLARLSDLIDRLLQAQALMDDQRKLNLQITDLCEETRIALDHMQGALIRKNMLLKTEIERELWAMTEPERWQLLVKNLLDNAVKYSPNGSNVRLSLAAKQGRILLTVTDQGIGLERTELDRIFDRFYRVGREDTRRTQGTGLGLYLVRRIAESFQGKAWAVSDGLGKGASFMVEIPAMGYRADA